MTSITRVLEKLRQNPDRRLLGPSLISFAIKFAGAGISYIMLVTFAHMMSPDEYGKFAFIFNLAIVIAGVIGFGFPTGIMRYWQKYLAMDRPDFAKGSIRLALWLNLIGVLAAIALALFLNSYAGASALFGKYNFLIVVLLGVSFAGADFAAGMLRAQHSVVGAMFPRDIAWRIIAPFTAFILTLVGYTMSSELAVIICATVLFALLIPQAFMILKNVRLVGGGIARLDWTGIRSSLPSLWGIAILYALIQQFDVVIVGSLLSGPETGAYFAAQKTATLLSLVLIAGGLVTAPTTAALFQNKKFEELQRLCKQLVTVISVVTLIGFLFLVLAGNLLLGMFNQSFSSAYWVLLVLGFGCMVDAVAGPTAYLMQMTSYEKAYLRIMAVCYAGVIGLQFILIPRFGSIGAAFASASGTIAWNICSVWVLRKKANLDPSLFGLFFPVKSKPKTTSEV